MVEVRAAHRADALAVRGTVEAGRDGKEELLADVFREVDLQVAHLLEVETEVFHRDRDADVVEAACADRGKRHGCAAGHDEVGAGHDS